MNTIKKIILLPFIILCAVTANAYPKATKQPADSTFAIMKRVADWQWNELETQGWKDLKTDWTNGVMYTGMVAWAKIANSPVYYDKLLNVGKSIDWKLGPNRSFADDYCIAQTYAQLYGIYKNPQYIADFKTMADSMIAAPHAENLLWVNKIHLREWAWCDALYMAPAALANLSDVTHDTKYLDEASKLWWKTSDYLYDKNEHLFFRDSRYFTQKEKNGKKVFWSRGNGWVMGGLANMLSKMPQNYPDRERFITEFKQMAQRIAGLQQSDGTWHASLLDPASYSSKETSGTGLFCYALAWGVNQKILSYNEYYPVIDKAWKALTASVHTDGKLGYVQPIGASPDKVTADDTEVYGVGAFLLAGCQMLILEKGNTRQ